MTEYMWYDWYKVTLRSVLEILFMYLCPADAVYVTLINKTIHTETHEDAGFIFKSTSAA